MHTSYISAFVDRQVYYYNVTTVIQENHAENESLNKAVCASYLKYEEQTALFKDPVRTAQ